MMGVFLTKIKSGTGLKTFNSSSNRVLTVSGGRGGGGDGGGGVVHREAFVDNSGVAVESGSRWFNSTPRQSSVEKKDKEKKADGKTKVQKMKEGGMEECDGLLQHPRTRLGATDGSGNVSQNAATGRDMSLVPDQAKRDARDNVVGARSMDANGIQPPSLLGSPEVGGFGAGEGFSVPDAATEARRRRSAPERIATLDGAVGKVGAPAQTKQRVVSGGDGESGEPPVFRVPSPPPSTPFDDAVIPGFVPSTPRSATPDGTASSEVGKGRREQGVADDVRKPSWSDADPPGRLSLNPNLLKSFASLSVASPTGARRPSPIDVGNDAGTTTASPGGESGVDAFHEDAMKRGEAAAEKGDFIPFSHLVQLNVNSDERTKGYQESVSKNASITFF